MNNLPSLLLISTMTSLIYASSISDKHIVYEIQNTTSQELHYKSSTSALDHIFPDGFEERASPNQTTRTEAQVNCTESTERLYNFSLGGKPCQHQGTNNNSYTMQYKEQNDVSLDLRLHVSSINGTCFVKRLS